MKDMDILQDILSEMREIKEEIELPYMPVFEEKMRCLGAYMSGSIPRLYQETEEKAEYFGTQFIDLWKEYLSTEE